MFEEVPVKARTGFYNGFGIFYLCLGIIYLHSIHLMSLIDTLPTIYKFYCLPLKLLSRQSNHFVLMAEAILKSVGKFKMFVSEMAETVSVNCGT